MTSNKDINNYNTNQDEEQYLIPLIIQNKIKSFYIHFYLFFFIFLILMKLYEYYYNIDLHFTFFSYN